MLSQLPPERRIRTVDGMNALQHHAFAQLLAARRRRDGARRQDELSERTDGRTLVDASRAPVRPSLENLR